MLKKIFTLGIFTFYLITYSQKITYTIDLNNVQNDQLSVTAEILMQESSSDSIWFCFPSVVPGTYERYHFGRFISNMKITDEHQNPVPFRSYNRNIFALRNMSRFYLQYQVDDTWDSPNKENFVFEPAGTNFEKNKNFVLNNHAIFGFLYGKEHVPVKIIVHHPAGFYPITGLDHVRTGTQTDTLIASSYHELVDSPVMYCLPDTLHVNLGNMQVWIGCYSPGKKITARFITNTLQELLFAQRDYMGGEFPISKYAFIFYFTDKTPYSGTTGALEHNNSSFYFLFNNDSSDMIQTLRDVCAHEFFHLITPLTLHSEEIGNFNYLYPKMSRHLWLYEGLTEYMSHHAQLLSGIINIDQFLEVMIEKLNNSRAIYNDKISFTEMSQRVLEDQMNKQYANVYEKGALINLCLDLLLLHHSSGKYGIRELMLDLRKKYGKNKSFKDEHLFDEIAVLTNPSIRNFFHRYVENAEPLPVAECLRYAGIIYKDSAYVKDFTLGNFDIGYDPKYQSLVVEDVANMDAFGKEMGIKKYDQLLSLNGRNFTASPADLEMISDFFQTLKEGDVVTMVVRRPKNKKRTKFHQVTLQAKARKVDVLKKNYLELDPEINENQKQVLAAWTGLSFR